MILNAINEGVVITVKDDKTGKTVTINTDELNDEGDKEAEEHDENTQGDVTFGDNQESEEEATEDTNSEENSTDEQPNESNEGGSKPEEKKEDKTSKKFRIKKKKTNESLGVTVYDALNENEVEVTDEVKYKNKNGNVVSKLSNGDIIVNFDGETDIMKPKSIKVVTNEAPKDTLNSNDACSTNESYCGIFLNGVRISPANCVTNKEAFKNAKDDDLINIVVEGVASEIKKQYVKLLS